MTTGWEPRPADGADSGEWRPALDVPAPGQQRRWTVLLRWLLLLPQFIAVFLLSFVAFFVAIVGWFAALVLGRLPDGIADFLGGVLVYQTRVSASAALLVDRYPPFAFDDPEYPVQIELRRTPLNRLAVFFRLILVIPAAIIGSFAASGWFVLSWVFWLICLILGRLPDPVFGATAAVVRYRMRLSAYMYLLTPVYPKGILGDEAGPAALQAPSATRPLVLDTGGKVLVWVFLALGLAGQLTSGTVDYDSDVDYQYAPVAPADRW
ncbi:DUF4389 domain-containing protein [Streptomyces sp. HUAS MG47]|uniref:DUF4389 domain-containing protein n=1 Tax=Streptomyces solicamelliae TaxID=3231716 RepID=UPI003877BBD4